MENPAAAALLRSAGPAEETSPLTCVNHFRARLPSKQSRRPTRLPDFAACPAILAPTTRPIKARGHRGATMQLETVRAIDPKDAPALAPDNRPIDLVHLARMTLGDRGLEREVLQLFDRQATLLIARMRSATPQGVATLAHTLKGSARGIGAWRVARGAEALEVAAGSRSGEIREALDHLAAAAEEAHAVIAELLLPN